MTAEVEDWVTRAAADVHAEAERRPADDIITCASGISPSGPIHLGNLREMMVPHLVADELVRRGLPCRHILSWDDYDRLRRVPAGLPGSFAEHIGRPLSAVPDPCGEHGSWAEHFKAPFQAALAQLGVEMVEISQTQMYTSGAYDAQILHAMRERARIDEVLARYRTRRSDAAEDDPYYPFRPYCTACGRDDTTVTSFDDKTTMITYTCACGVTEGPVPIADVPGKLVWKVDWPMRWAFERVTFETAGVDHSSPGSSFTVGSQLVREIFDARPPFYFGYSFVGTTGSAKMSGSTGGAPTPTDALRIFEPPLLRWLYARRRPNQAITLAFDNAVSRTYDEWDALSQRVAAGQATPGDVAMYRRASSTASSALPETPRRLPFRTLASIADITAGDERQMLRIFTDLTADDPIAGLDDLRPRLDCAQVWVTDYLAPDERTHIRTEPDRERLDRLTESEQHAIKLLVEGLADNWSLDGLTTLLYGVPKVQRGLPLDTPPTQELKAAQRRWFVLLYQLLIGKDTGPRLPTLLLSLGADRVRSLLL